MTRRSYSGNAPATTLSAGINNSTLTLTVVSGTGYPSGAGGPFFIVVDPGLANEEKILCDSTSGGTINANAAGRGADSTTAASHALGAVVQHVLTATDADEANAHVNVTTDDNHPQYYNASRFIVAHDIEARHVFGAAYGTPATPASVAAIGSPGSGSHPAREDHVHVGGSLGSLSSQWSAGTHFPLAAGTDVLTITGASLLAGRRYLLVASGTFSIGTTGSVQAQIYDTTSGRTQLTRTIYGPGAAATTNSPFYVEYPWVPGASTKNFALNFVASSDGISTVFNYSFRLMDIGI